MWRTTPGQAYRLRPFDDPAGIEYVIYNDLTGATHLLGEAAVHLIQVLRCGPASSADLCAALAVALECEADASLAADTEALLAQLADYFLIERAA
jgi:PqqD family protein of HPr-rel-A system